MRKRSAWTGYFMHAFLGYCGGLLVTMVVVVVLGIAQPALLYLVPSTLLPIAVAAVRKGELSHFWNQGTGTAMHRGDASQLPL